MPSRRQPIFNVPGTLLGLIVAMAAIEGARHLLSDATDAAVLARFAFVPARLTVVFDPAAVIRHLQAFPVTGEAGRDRLLVARFFLGDGSAQPWTALTYAVLHGGWMHLGLNCVWLLAFGAPVERRLGPFGFLTLFAAGALAGAATHYAIGPLSTEPLVGASAAVSACMGAALRFVFQGPGDRLPGEPPHQAPRLSLRATVSDRRSAAFLVVWFVSNCVTGLVAVPLGLSDMPIAWQAHIGGFLLGLLGFPLFDPVRPRPVAPKEQETDQDETA